jgi:hypothetical protein
MNEAEAIERLRKFATDPAARGLADPQGPGRGRR